jgi:hypothetical protein
VLREEIASKLADAMSARDRKYHTIQHVVDVAGDFQGVVCLAALFHDVIYAQVDRRIPPRWAPLIPEFLYEASLHWKLPDPSQLETGIPRQTYERVLQVFGWTSGAQTNVFQGANEFLSALVAARTFARILPEKEWLSIVALIEATIPFRDKPLEELRSRLEKMGLWTSAELERILDQGAALVSRDLSSFANPDSREFLKQTWTIVLEGNPIFRSPCFTVSQYRQALERLENYFQSLHLDRLQASIQMRNSDPKVGKTIQTNLSVGKSFLQAQYDYVLALEAFSHLTGGDVPYAIFLRDFDTRVAQGLVVPTEMPDDARSAIELLSSEGPQSSISEAYEFQFTFSKGAAYLFSVLDEESRTQLRSRSQEYRSDPESWALPVLRALPVSFLKRLQSAAQEALLTRAQAAAALQFE